MSDTPETLADALAAARKMLDEDSWIDEATALDEDGEPDDLAQRVVRANDVRDALARIEAAAKREQQDAMKTAFLTKCKVCEKVGPASAPGNAAALREALETVCDSLHTIAGGISPEFCASLADEAKAKIRAALDAPARNCDRFADCNSAWKAYNAIADRERLPGFDFWLFALAKGETK